MEKISLSDDEIKEFRLEAQELLDSCEASLLQLEAGGDFQQHYDSIFRAFHTIKGAAGMLSLLELQAHVHELESKLIDIKSQVSLSKEDIDLFLKGCDGTRRLLDGKSKEDVSEKIPDEFFSEADELAMKIENFLKLAPGLPGDENLNTSLYREVHTLKGILQLYGFETAGRVAHAMESVLDQVRAGAIVLDEKNTPPFLEALDLIVLQVNAKRDGRELDVEEKCRPLIKAMEAMSQSTTTTVPSVPEQIETKNSAECESPGQERKAAVQEANNTIRVPVNLLDNLMRLMGEMVLVRNQVIQFSSKSDDLAFLNLSQRLDIVTSEIQGEVMKTRMQPIGNVLSKFNRVVRDLARELNKKIDLVLEGMETELDKSLLEMIKDPLMHIVRNSCDHGIEDPEVRRRSGKTELGTILIRAYHEGGQVVIEIKDDGKGLDRERILAKAVEKGLLNQDKVSSLSERDINMLIFNPGFSTAAKVSNVSGRGVGMDVVKNNIEKMGGVIDLNSVHGKGTTLRLKIPLTLAIIPAMIVKSKDQRYAIPQVKLVELVRIEKGKSSHQIEVLQGRPVLRLRGSLLPLVGLSYILDREAQFDADAEISNIVVLNADHLTFGLIVDEILDTADIVVKPLSRFLKSLPFYSGATVLGDGSVSLILDVFGLLMEAFGSEANNDEAARLRANSAKEEDSTENQEFLLFRLNTPSTFGLPLGIVHRLEEFSSKDIEWSGDQRIIQYRNTLLPIISLNKFFGFGEDRESDVISVLVLKKGDKLFGLQVNEIMDVNSTHANFDDSASDRDGIMGNIVIGTEMVVLVDTLGILDKEIKRIGRNKGASATGVEKKRTTNRVLLVEDTAFFRKQVSKILTRQGYDVVTKDNGEEALQWLEQNSAERLPVDLVLSDIEMPKMNGWELARKLRAHHTFGALPLVALTTRFNKEDVKKGLDCGFDVYLEKLNEDVLIEQLTQVSQARRKVS